MAETYFDILGLPPISDFGKIASAYRQKKAEFKGDPVRLNLIEEAYRVLMNPMSLRKYLEDPTPVEAPTLKSEKDAPLSDPSPEIKVEPQNEIPIKSSGKRQKTEIFEFKGGVLRQAMTPDIPIKKNARQRTEIFEPGSGEQLSGKQKPAVSDVPKAKNIQQQTEAETTESTLPSENTLSPSRHTKPNRLNPGIMASEYEKPKKRAFITIMYAGEKMEFALKEGENIIGRPSKKGMPPDVPLADADRFVSRRHAMVVVKGSKYLLHDMGSANGSYLNNERLQPLTYYPLKDGDVIEIEGRRLIINIA
jgi:hypothetical protein